MGAAVPLALATAFAIAAWRMGATIGDVAAQHAWRATWVLLAAALVVALAPRIGSAVVGGAYVGGVVWVLVGYETRQPWPDSVVGVALNLALVATAPVDALRDVPSGWAAVAIGAAGGALGAWWVARTTTVGNPPT